MTPSPTIWAKAGRAVAHHQEAIGTWGSQHGAALEGSATFVEADAARAIRLRTCWRSAGAGGSTLSACECRCEIERSSFKAAIPRERVEEERVRA